MAEDDYKIALEALRIRVTAIEEGQCLTPDQRRAQIIVLRIVDAAIKVVWLTNGAVKTLGVPVGIMIGVYAYGLDILDLIISSVKELLK